MVPTPTHQIKVDDEVLAALAARTRPFDGQTPNDVLRDLLLSDTGPSVRPTLPGSNRRPGALMDAIERGELHAGDKLVCAQPRRKRTFEATVTPDGWIALSAPLDGEYDKPSPALRACTGGQINGWGNWTHARSGKVLQAFRH